MSRYTDPPEDESYEDFDSYAATQDAEGNVTGVGAFDSSQISATDFMNAVVDLMDSLED